MGQLDWDIAQQGQWRQQKEDKDASVMRGMTPDQHQWRLQRNAGRGTGATRTAPDQHNQVTIASFVVMIVSSMSPCRMPFNFTPLHPPTWRNLAPSHNDDVTSNLHPHYTLIVALRSHSQVPGGVPFASSSSVIIIVLPPQLPPIPPNARSPQLLQWPFARM